MEENRIPKRVLYMNLGTTRSRGRPRNGWQDGVREDGRIVGGVGWQEKVHNRQEWKKLLRMARNRQILHMSTEWMNESDLSTFPDSTVQYYIFIFTITFYDVNLGFIHYVVISRFRILKCIVIKLDKPLRWRYDVCFRITYYYAIIHHEYIYIYTYIYIYIYIYRV